MATNNWTKFKLLMWKNWIIQKRSKGRTLYEILIPVLIISALMIARNLVDPKSSPEMKYDEFRASRFPLPYRLIHNLPCPREIKLSYSPNSKVVEKVVEESMKYLMAENVSPFLSILNNNVIQICFPDSTIPEDFEDKLKWLYNNIFTIIGYDNATTLEGHLTNPIMPDESFCGIQFDDSLFDMNDPVDWPMHTNLMLRFPAQLRRILIPNPIFNWQTNLLFPMFSNSGPRNENNSYGGEPSYVEEGFMGLSHAILREVTKLKSDNADQPPIYINRFPYPKVVVDSLLTFTESFIGLCLAYSFYVTFVNTVEYITLEKENQIKEVLKIMGMQNWLHWSSWFLKTFINMFIIAVLIIVLLKMQIYTSKEGLTGYGLITYTPWHVLLFFFVFYIISAVFFCFFLSTLFSSATTASISTTIVWMLSLLSYQILSTADVLPDLGIRLSACLLSNTAFLYGFQIIVRFETTTKGLHWEDFSTPLSADDPITMTYMLLMMVIDSFIYLILALYIEQLFPGDFGIPKKWYFPFTKSFWFREKPKVFEDYEETTEEDVTIESEPRGFNVGIRIQNLSKKYGDRYAVDKLNLKIFEDQITVLLGHNGAGKTTTISMLTGMFPPTTGTAIINGYDLRKDIKGVRNSLSICPQHNVLFNKLTVGEHLEFFAILKGTPENMVKHEVDKYVKLLDLEDKRDVISKSLSGGMKRKLGVGTALCGNSKVVLLDEPTSGMDPAARRHLWDLLHLEKKDRTIILTTHFMDEAEILGERVAILSEGKLRCVGSPFFLKKRLGMGYKLICVRQSHNNFSYVPILELLQRYVPEAKLYTDIGSEISFILPDESTNRFQAMLEDLERKQGELELNGFGLMAPTLEEVFMRVGSNTDESNDNNKDISGDDKVYLEDSSLVMYKGFKLLRNQWKAMFMKKILFAARRKLLTFLHLFTPIIYLIIQVVINNQVSLSRYLQSRDLELSKGYVDSVTFLSTKTERDSMLKLKDAYKQYFDNSSIDTMLLRDIGNVDMEEYYLRTGAESIDTMRLKHLIGGTLSADKIVAWFSNAGYHDLPASVILAHTAIMGTLTNFTSTFSLTNNPLPFTLETEFSLNNNQLTSMVSVFLLMSILMAISFFVIFYVKENTTRSKLLQMTTGVSPFTMWTVAFLLDFLWFNLIGIILLTIILVLSKGGLSTGVELGNNFVPIILFAWSMLPLLYLMSTLITRQSGAFVKVYTANLLLGVILDFLIHLVLPLIVAILYNPESDIEDIADIVHHIAMVFPPYSLNDALKKLSDISVTLETCNKACELFGNINNCTIETICRLSFEQCCISEDEHFKWTKKGIAVNMTYMLCVGFLAFAVLYIKEYQIINYIYKPWVPKLPNIDSETEDSDVKEERKKIEELPTIEQYKYNLLCKNMSKFYGKFLAVNQLSFGVSDGECFGLLGVNGAGKTSTFKMLTGDLRISSGEAWVKGVSVNTNLRSIYKSFGYCPQFDALLNELTGRETLMIYAMLRGIPQWRQDRFIDDISRRLGFEQHLDKPVGAYSGGNKRKLSTSIALLGDPQVIYLDEPTTGMDPGAKRLVWNAISKCRCVILTSHSMEECEALCTRLCIMVNGYPQCLGSPQHLKNKFSQGYTLMVKLRSAQDKQEVLDQFINKKFIESKILESCQGLITYYLPDTTIKWSTIFGIMEAAKDELNIEDYSIGQTSLEQIFLQFTKNQI